MGVVIGFLFMIVVSFSLLIYVQIQLSKRESPFTGLVIPVLLVFQSASSAWLILTSQGLFWGKLAMNVAPFVVLLIITIGIFFFVRRKSR